MSVAAPPAQRVARAPFVAALIATFVASLDNVVVTLALPRLREAFDVSVAALAWTVNAYTIPFAVLMLAATTAADRFGAVRVFRCGLVLFGISSIAAALSEGMTSFVVARAAQGVAAAAVVPLALALAVRGVPAERRPVTTAAVSAAQGLSAALGPFIGGLVVQVADWPWLFWVNVPLSVAALVLIRRVEDPQPGHASPRLAMLALGCAGLALVTSAALHLGEPGARGWSVVLQGAAGLGLLGLFGHLDRRADRPVIPQSLMRSRSFVLATAAGLLVTAGIFGSIFVLVQYLQVGRGYEPLQAGLATLPWTLMPVTTAPIAPRLAARWGLPWTLTTSAVVLGVGTAWLALLADDRTPYSAMVPGMLLAGAGMGCFFALTASQVLEHVAERDQTVAVGVATSARETGVLLGTATSAVLMGLLMGAATTGTALVSATRPVVLGSLLLVLFGAVCAALARPQPLAEC